VHAFLFSTGLERPWIAAVLLGEDFKKKVLSPSKGPSTYLVLPPVSGDIDPLPGVDQIRVGDLRVGCQHLA
jgi:hypothetical protein